MGRLLAPGALEALASPAARAEALATIYHASLDQMRYRRHELGFTRTPDPISLVPVNDYRFPEPRPEPKPFDRPLPSGKDVLEWLLESAE